MWKTRLVWLTIAVGSLSPGCRCAHGSGGDSGIHGMDTGVIGVGDACSDTMPCPTGLYCLGGSCAVDCSASSPCPGGARCSSDGRCVGGACSTSPAPSGCGHACSATMTCAAGLYCTADGTCSADCSASLLCRNGQMCSADGHCIGGGSDAGVCSLASAPTGCGSSCSGAMPCGSGLYCLGGTCTADCSGSAPCASGGTCSSDGHCVGGGSTDAGVCSGSSAPLGCGSSCSGTTPCRSGLYCLGGMCTADCSSMAPCASGGTCSSDGHCVGGGGDSGTMVSCNPILGEMDCGGGVCVSTRSDPANCGTCGHACAGAEVCSTGICSPMCMSTRLTNCSRHCVDFNTDRANCGMCDHACPNNMQCLMGTCGCASGRGETLCDQHCVILDSDRINCGSCGHECLTTCASRAATCDTQGIGCGPAGDGCGNMLDCGGCTAPETCGGGGILGQCGTRDGGPCVPTTCAALGVTCGPVGNGCGGMIDCGSCTLPDTCGGGGVLGHCGRPVCSHQTCMDMCPGTTLCFTPQDGDRVDSICFDTGSDARNCGGCGITCGLGTCSGGSCTCSPAAQDAGPGADAGRAFCPPEGCTMCGPSVGCVNTDIDLRHCGNCATVCHAGQACTMGHCLP